MIQYESAYRGNGGDYRLVYDDPEKAAQQVETTGFGVVTKWQVEPNAPGQWARKSYRCLAQWVLENGVWHALDLETRERVRIERPGCAQ